MTTIAPAASAQAEQFETGKVTTVTLGHAIHDVYTAFLPPLLPVLIQKFALSNAQAGLLNVFMQWPSLLQPVIGYLADRRNLRFLFIIGPAVAGICMSLLPVAPSYLTLAFLLTAVGVTAGGLHSVGSVLAGNVSGRSLGRGMGMWMVGGGLGYTVGPLLIVAALDVLKPQGAPWLMIGGIVTSLALWVGLRNTSSVRRRAVQSQGWRQALVVMRPILLPAFGIAVVRSFMGAALSTFLPTFLSSEGSSLWFAGGALSLFEAAGMVGALTSGSLSDRIGRRRVLASTMAVATPLMIAFLVFGGPARLVIMLALGFCALSTMPVMLAIMQESFPENRAMANGFYLGLSFLTNAAATLALGIFADAWGMRTAFAISAAIPVLGVPLVWLLPGRRNQ
jgi:FSR family fosmidomycin resistance protein-like MFS transporter